MTANELDIDKQIRQTLGGSMELLEKIMGENAQKSAIPKAVGIQCEAQISISTKNEGMEATICVYSPAPGGADVTIEQIRSAVAAKAIVYGVDWDLLENIAKEKLYDAIFTFAQGDPKEDGKNGRVTPRYDEVRKLKPKLLEDGTVDFRDLGAVVNIRKGDPICDIEEATPGKNGKNIYGTELAAIPGKPATVPMGTNTAINGDGTLLIAQKDGNLRYDRGKFLVETEFVVNGDVDVSTGNIRFIGDIIVKGNVETGFVVESDKSITVNGMVNGVQLIAGESVSVRNGAINSEITAKEGSVKVGFAENCRITCKSGLKTASMVSCSVHCEGDIDCTSNPGTIVGGSYEVFGSIHCMVLGHRSYISTNIELGNLTLINREQEMLKQQIDALNIDIEKLEGTVNLIKALREKGVQLDQQKEQLMTAAVRLKVQKTMEKKPLLARTVELDSFEAGVRAMTVQVSRALYPNVKIAIGAANTVNRNEYGKCIARSNGEEIVIG